VRYQVTVDLQRLDDTKELPQGGLVAETLREELEALEIWVGDAGYSVRIVKGPK
jgi:hypothetical protein